MNGKYHSKLMKEGWIPEKVILKENLPEELTNIALAYARGKFSDYRIIPAEIAMEGDEWIPKEGQHIVYVPKKDAKKEVKNKRGPVIGAITLDCIHKRGGDEQNIPVIYGLKKR